jgi:hypothetical protein
MNAYEKVFLDYVLNFFLILLRMLGNPTYSSAFKTTARGHGVVQ